MPVLQERRKQHTEWKPETHTVIFAVLFCNNICKQASWFILELIDYKQPRHRITESENSRGWKGPLWVI